MSGRHVPAGDPRAVLVAWVYPPGSGPGDGLRAGGWTADDRAAFEAHLRADFIAVGMDAGPNRAERFGVRITAAEARA